MKISAESRGFGRAQKWAAIPAAMALILILGALFPGPTLADGLNVDQLLQMREVRDVAISPDGSLVAHILDVPRRAGVDEDGPAWRELHVVSSDGHGRSRGYITGDVKISDPTFTADGRWIVYRAKRFGDEESALWAIPVDGGESRKLLDVEGLGAYRISPDGKQLALLVTPPESEDRQQAQEKGYDREVFEEEWRAQELWIADFPTLDPEPVDPSAADDVDGGTDEDAMRHLEVDGSVGRVEWSPDGSQLVIGVQPRNLIDDEYMQRRIRVLNASDGSEVIRFDNPGKLSDFAAAPGGLHIAMVSAQDHSDPSPGRLMLGNVADGSFQDLMPDFEAHVRSFVWQDAQTLIWVADEGSETTLGTVTLDGTMERVLRSKASLGVPIIQGLRMASDGRLAFRGNAPSHPAEAFSLRLGDRPKRLTNSNPWLDRVKLAKQEVVTWTASDGLELEGILIHPLDGRKKAPLLLMVHGGPEANDRNGWVSNYSRPGQIAAARGYAVLYPNYRGSTGRGVAFSKHGHADAAGKEFQDLVEAVDHLIQVGIASDRVGITGGSYGGYATAWCSTYYTDRFKAGAMFVGISNKLSKGFTTDIPNEDIAVHTTFVPWTKWKFSLERSPLYHASKSKTPLLIAGGTGDTRVHPSQSLQLYRAMKLQDKVVRYVRYPDEPHGNQRAASRHDYLERVLRWMDHFVKEGNTELPPVELD